MFGLVFLFIDLVISFVLVDPSLGEILIFQVDGEVSRENFMYYKLMNGGNLLLELISVGGDADLYITSQDILPSFYPDHYDLHSATCGRDLIYLPGNFKRPVTLGIYGHPSHEVANFTLRVYQLPTIGTAEEPNFEVEYNRQDVSHSNHNQGEEVEADPQDQGEAAPRPLSTPTPTPGMVHAAGGHRREEGATARTQGPSSVRRKMRAITSKTGLWAFLEIFEMLFL